MDIQNFKLAPTHGAVFASEQSDTPTQRILQAVEQTMSSTTFEERKSVALAACFNDKRCHRRLIGHRARTFDFQVKFEFPQHGST